MFAQGNAPDRHGVPSHQPLHVLESGARQALQTRWAIPQKFPGKYMIYSTNIYWIVVLVKLCKQGGEPNKASWKMLFYNAPFFLHAQDVRERSETLLEWTLEWRTQGLKRQRMGLRKERRRCETKWWMDSRFLRPVHRPGDPQQACGTWTCSRISSTGRASLRSIRLLWRTTARTEES